MAELTRSEQIAYEASAARTKKQAARDRGATDALKGAPAGAVERARARALGQVEAPAAATSTAATKPSGRIIQTPEGPVPEEFYDLSPADQKRFRKLAAEREKKTTDENVALSGVNQLLDLREQDARRVRALESQLTTLLTVVEALQRQIAAINTTVEVAKSDALAEQLASTSEATLSAANVEVSLRNQTAASRSEMAQLGVEHRERIEAEATAINALSGSVKSTTFLTQERCNAAVAQVAAMEPRVQKLDVRLQELEGKTDAWTDPITRAEVNTMATETVAEQWREQLPALVDAVAEEMQLQFPDGIHAGRRDSEYVRRQRADAAVLAEQRQGGR